VGILFALGGAAVGGIAFGGAALGVIAVGGGACGYYALGDGGVGVHTISAMHQDPAARDFFQEYFSLAGQAVSPLSTDQTPNSFVLNFTW
jgi:hypothetical protein